MSGHVPEPLSERISTGLAGVDGVRATFSPREAISADRLASARGGRVLLDASGPSLRIAARLAIDRAVPAPTVLAGIVTAVDRLVGGQPYVLDLEIAVID